MVPNTRVITELDSTAEITSQMGPSTVWAYMVFRFRITRVLMRVRYSHTSPIPFHQWSPREEITVVQVSPVVCFISCELSLTP